MAYDTSQAGPADVSKLKKELQDKLAKLDKTEKDSANK